MIHYITPTGIASPWIVNELAVVKRHAVPFELHTLRGHDHLYFSSEFARELDQRTHVLYPLSAWTLMSAFFGAPMAFGFRFWSALANALFGERENFRNRIAAGFHFMVACVWARRLRHQSVSRIHSQWIHSGGTVGMYGAWLLGVPFSFTGHAADLYRERVALADKVRRADFIVCISRFHENFFRELGAREEQLVLAYCGIDVSHFAPPAQRRQNQVPHILSSGRLVEKKGFAPLIEACKLLRDRGIEFRCTIGGNGPLESALRQQIADLGLQDHVVVTGEAITQEALPAFMHQGDIYALPCVWAADGDVDGLPQMLMEAMACGLPAVSTRLVGIPDLIEDERSGLLVQPGHVEQLANALERLIKDPDLADRLATVGRQVVLDRFQIDTSLQPLIARFRQSIGSVVPVARAGAAEATR